MTTPGNRFQSWIDSLSTAWSARLGDWAGTFIGHGIEKFMDVLAKHYAKDLLPFITELETIEDLPEQLKPLIEEMKNPTGEAAAALLTSLGNRVTGSAISDMLNALFLPTARAISRKFHSVVVGPDIAIQWLLRHPGDMEAMSYRLKSWGYDDLEQALMVELAHPIFPSEVVAPAWLRDKAKYEKYWDDVRGLGVSEDRLELLKDLAYRVPGAADVIRYAVKEAYSPEIYKAFGQDAEFPTLALKDAEAAGVREDHLLKEWIAHWNLPGVSQGFDLMHRREITTDELNKLLKALDIMPFWRDKLTALSWNVPNRIELRMMARYGLVDKKLLMEVLEFNGTDPRYREIIADMMLAQGLMTDLPVRYRNKWINSDEVKAELAEAGLSQDIQDRIYKWIVKNAGPERTAGEKDLTAAEIIKGVKKGMLSWGEAVQQLVALGYDEVEASYKLAIDVEVAEVAPTTEINTRVDTIRRQRRQRLISRDEQIGSFLDLGIDVGVATAYADNDDMRLVKVAVAKPPEVILAYQTAQGKLNIDTIRLQRRENIISRNEEITSLVDLDMPTELAVSYADNDELRIPVVKPAVLPPVILFYQTEVGKVQVDTIRLAARQRKLTRAQTAEDIRMGVPPVFVTGDEAREREIDLLSTLEMSEELATAYADNDELRLVKETTGGTE